MSSRELWQIVDGELGQMQSEYTGNLIMEQDATLLQIGQRQGFIRGLQAARDKLAECHKKLYGDFS